MTSYWVNLETKPVWNETVCKGKGWALLACIVFGHETHVVWTGKQVAYPVENGFAQTGEGEIRCSRCGKGRRWELPA